MYTSITRNRIVRILFAISSLSLSSLTFGQAEKEASGDKTKTNQIVIKNFHFDPQVLTVRSGDKITWINRDEEPHTVVSVEKQFKKSSALDTDQEFTITAGAPGTYTYYCSVHPKMTGTIVVVESSTTTQLYEINTLFAAIETRPSNCFAQLVLGGPTIAEGRDRSLLSRGPVSPGSVDYPTESIDGSLTVCITADGLNDGSAWSFPHSFYPIYRIEGKLLENVKSEHSARKVLARSA